jgi:hypothetical protein
MDSAESVGIRRVRECVSSVCMCMYECYECVYLCV